MSYFPNVDKVKYEGPDSTNPLAFKYYNPEEKVGDKTMKEILRFSVAYWHTFTNELSDPFGGYAPFAPGTNTPAWIWQRPGWRPLRVL